MVFFLVLILGFLPAFIAAVLAANRGRSGWLWFLLGFLFSWIAVLIVACLGTEETSKSTDEYPSGVPKPLYSREEEERRRVLRNWEIESTILGPKPTKPDLLPIPSKPLLPREPKLTDDKYRMLLGFGELLPWAMTKKKKMAVKAEFAADHAKWEQEIARIRPEHEKELAAWKEEMQRIAKANKQAETNYLKQVEEWRHDLDQASLNPPMPDQWQTQQQISEPATEKIQLSVPIEEGISPVQLLQKFLTIQEKYNPYKALLVTFEKPVPESTSIRFLSIKNTPDFQETALKFITPKELEQWEKLKLGGQLILHEPMG